MVTAIRSNKYDWTSNDAFKKIALLLPPILLDPSESRATSRATFMFNIRNVKNWIKCKIQLRSTRAIVLDQSSGCTVLLNKILLLIRSFWKCECILLYPSQLARLVKRASNV